MDSPQKLPLGVKLGYGAGDVAGNLFFTVVAFWLMNYLTDEVGLSAALAGAALMVGKLWDGVTDPAVGFLSDRTRSRWGRRRPWFLFGAIPLGVSFFVMFLNPGLTGDTSRFIWATLAYMLICTTCTCVNIPYNALTPELTKDFNERTSLNGYRMMFAVVGTLIGAGSAMPILEQFQDRTHGFMAMGAVYGLILIVFSLIPFFAVREPPPEGQQGETKIFRAYGEALQNRPFLLILIPWVLNTIGVTVVTGTLIYYFKYIYQNESAMTGALMVLLLTSMVFIPVSVLISKRLGKRLTYMGGLSIFIIAVIGMFLFGHIYGLNMAYACMFVAGVGFSTHYVLPWAMIPDTVEYDYAKSGVRREGVYYGLWTFAIKLGQAVAGLGVGLALSWSGYVPDEVQSESALFGIRFLVGPGTAIFFIFSIIVLYFYPIDQKMYEEIRLQIKEMEKC